MTYFVRVAPTIHEVHRVVGPYPTAEEAHTAGIPFAEEGLDVEVIRDVPMCDFCCDPESKVQWSYPARDFSVAGTMWASRGAWAACGKCHEMIQRDDWSGLSRYSVSCYFTNHPEVPQTQWPRVARAIRGLHMRFRMVRLDRPHRESSS